MGASITKPQQDQFKRLEHCHEPESSTTPQSAYCEPRSLNRGRKVFLSHSGGDKDFARYLYRDLCSSYHGFEVAFFDEESLSKGESINMEKRIEEAKGSALGVLVLTDDFFMHTRYPMLELEAFVTGNVDLLPLFLTMSVNEFKEEERWNRWEKKWKEWAAADNKLAIEKWRSHLKYVRTYNGLEFCKIAPHGRQDLFIDEVVKQVAHIIGLVVPMSGEDLYGNDRLCQMVDDMYQKCSSNCSSPHDSTATEIASTSARPKAIQVTSTFVGLGHGENSGLYAYDIVGIHGFPGLGKTTVCKCLCDFYFEELKGKVCYIDLSSSESRFDRMQYVLSRLDRGNTNNIHNLQLDGNQVENLLKKRFSSMKDRVFLAIDNVLPEWESQEEALTYLRCKLPTGSKILITSRSESILKNLTSLLPHGGNFSVVIEYMPALVLEEARGIFEHEFPDLHYRRRSNVVPAIEENLERDVDACVSKCILFYGKWYHPLMLKSLAAYVKWDKLPCSTPDWKWGLAKLASEGIVHKNAALEMVFEVFEKFYGLLAEKAKIVFLDLALCYSATIGTSVMQGDADYHEWIKMLHLRNFDSSDRKMREILLQLQEFCFIGQRDLLYFGRELRAIEFQNLLVDFGKHKLLAGADSEGYWVLEDVGAGADSDGYVVLDDGAHCLNALPRNTRHVSISRCGKELRMLDLRDAECVTVLHLLDNAGLEEVLLSGTTSAHLHSIIVSVPASTALCCIINEDWSSQSLKWLLLKGNIDFCFQSSQLSLMLPDAQMNPGSMFFGGFVNLEHLSLDSLSPRSVQSIDLTPCANLKWLKVENMPGLKSIQGPESSSRLEQVSIKTLPHLEELTFTVTANSKTRFSVEFCTSLQRVLLRTTTPAISYAGGAYLTIGDCPLVANVGGLPGYAGWFIFYVRPSVYEGRQYRFWTETFVDMMKDAGIDSSRCKATVTRVRIDGCGSAGLKGVRDLCLEDAQHIGLLISAMFQAQPTDLQELRIRCQQAGDGCGCDQNAPPQFGTFPILDNNTSYGAPQPEFHYYCPQVRNLASLAQWRSLRYLSLRGCTSVEVWPDFAVMTSLFILDLSNTSLKEWPAGVQRLPDLEYFVLRGCRQLSAEELIWGAITPDLDWERETSWDSAPVHMCIVALTSLREDLMDGTRDRCLVADALDALFQTLVDLFGQWWPDSGLEEERLRVVLEIMYVVWFGGRDGDIDEKQKLYIREKMRGLLSSDSFLSLPFCGCSEEFWSGNTTAAIRVLGIALVGGASLAYNSYRALPALEDEDLRDRTITFFKENLDHLISALPFIDNFIIIDYCDDFHGLWTVEEETEVLIERVGIGLCVMAREAGLKIEGDSEPQSDTGSSPKRNCTN